MKDAHNKGIDMGYAEIADQVRNDEMEDAHNKGDCYGL
jgi:hypothetical protein